MSGLARRQPKEGDHFGLRASTASAQPRSPQTATGEWRFELVPYLWGSGLEGQVGVLNQTADVDASFWNILDHLHFAAMGMADAQKVSFPNSPYGVD
jgi:hypothetical protein